MVVKRQYLSVTIVDFKTLSYSVGRGVLLPSPSVWSSILS